MARICIPDDEILHRMCDDAEFIEIHLDEQYFNSEEMTFYSGQCSERGPVFIQANTKHFWDPDQCFDFITKCQWKKVFITLTDHFSYLVPLIDELPQIVYIYIYSIAPDKIPYSINGHKKLRAIVDANSPDADKPLLSDIQTFRRDLMPININEPIQRKTKLLIQEPLPVDDYCIMWMDDNDININIDKKSITDIINRLDIFSSIEQCIDAIKLSAENTKIFLISSHSDVDTVIKEVTNLSNVIAIYIFDHDEQQTTINLNSSIPKMHGRYSDIEILSKQLLHDYKDTIHNSSLPISIFSREQNERTVRDLSKESARFLWLQLLIDILIRTPYNEQAKEEMLAQCRIHYQDNESMSNGIEEFDKKYKSTEALKCYTNDSFAYRLFNQALRTENIDFLFIFRFFLADMYKQLQELYIKQFLNKFKNADEKLFVYRGQLMKVKEFDQIKNNVGHLISIGTFFSTTRNKNVAVMIYSGSSSPKQEPNLLSVVFEIEISLNHDATKRPFASIAHLSQFPDEEEILFSVGATFRIIDVDEKQTDNEHYWHVKMIMVEEDPDLKELRNDLEKEYFAHGSLCDLGHALIRMCDYERAERFFNMLLEYLPEHHPSMSHIQSGLGIIYANRGDYENAIKIQEKALEFYMTTSMFNQNKDNIGTTYVHIGAAYRHLGNFDLALKYCLMAADIQSHAASLEFTYNEIAITYRDKGENRLALEYFLKALHIDEQVLKLSKYHPTLATAYNNIGEIHYHLGDLDNGLKYLEHALEIRLKGTVSSHTDLAAIYHNLGTAYHDKKELNKALEMLKKALEIDTKVLPSDHESLAHSHYEIGYILLNLDDLPNALEYAEKNLRILLRSQAKDNHPLIAKSQCLIGNIQCRLGDTTKASKMAEKALNNTLACSSKNQKDLAFIYDLYSKISGKEGNISLALEYANKAIEQAKLWAMHNRTFELEYFLTRLDELKKNSANENGQYHPSRTAEKKMLDNINPNDLISEINKELDEIPENDIRQRLDLLASSITLYSRDKNYSMAMACFDQANNIYIKSQSSDNIHKQQLNEAMIAIFYNAARIYYRQQEWNRCLNLLNRSIELVQQQNEEPAVIPEIYYCMATTYANLQNINLAIHYYQLTIKTAKKRLPDDHPDMQRYRFQLEFFQKNVAEAYAKWQSHH